MFEDENVIVVLRMPIPMELLAGLLDVLNRNCPGADVINKGDFLVIKVVD
jgi:hypothetical protein